jgi:hypothetical protein
MHRHLLFFFPLIPFILGTCAGAFMVCACRSGGKKKAKIARLEARLEALERKA